MNYQEIIKSAIKQALEELEINPPENIHLETPAVSEHGDFSSNVAMQTWSDLASSKSFEGSQPLAARISAVDKFGPRQLAEAIKEKIISRPRADQSWVEKIEIAGPGFLNFWLSKEALLKNLGEVLEKSGSLKRYGEGKRVVIDYSSPNIAKRFSVGHLRSTVVGQALYNLYTVLGFDTVGDNHLGDWGTQFGMILAGLEKYDLEINKLSVEDLENLYVRYSAEAKEKPELRDKAKTWFKRLEEGDPEARKLWQKAVDISLEEFDKIYQKLAVKIDYAYGESFYEDKMQTVIDEAKSKNLARASEGALIFEFKDLPPAMLLKSDGTTTYFTRDLATVKFRLDEFNPAKIIYEVGAEQTLHFKQVFAAAEKLGWAKGVEFKHVAHGLFLINGKKMSTRKGTNVKLSELLDKAVKKARKAIDGAQVAKDLSEAEKQEISKKVGIGAVKYFDLKHSPNSNIDFNWEDALNMQGNSGPYLQYTYARTQSVLRKSDKPLATNYQLPTTNLQETLLLRSFSQYKGIIIDAAKNYSPNTLANYLYDLAQKFNTFYNMHNILNPKGSRSTDYTLHTTNFRLALTAATGNILKSGLEILGIEAPKKM